MNTLTEPQLMTYLSCPLKFQFEQVDGLEEGPPSSAQAFDKAIHTALFAFHRSRMQGTPMDAEALIERFRIVWEEARDGVVYANGDTHQSLGEKGTRLLTRYREERPHTEVLAVDPAYSFEPIDPDTGEILEVTLTGTIDLIEAEGPVTAVDFKTGARRLTQEQVQHSLRLTLYAAALEDQGILEPGLRIDLLLKTKEPQVVPYPARRGLGDQHKLFQTVQTVVRAIEAEIFYPHYGYHCTSCPFAEACQAW